MSLVAAVVLSALAAPPPEFGWGASDTMLRKVREFVGRPFDIELVASGRFTERTFDPEEPSFSGVRFSVGPSVRLSSGLSFFIAAGASKTTSGRDPVSEFTAGFQYEPSDKREPAEKTVAKTERSARQDFLDMASAVFYAAYRDDLLDDLERRISTISSVADTVTARYREGFLSSIDYLEAMRWVESAIFVFDLVRMRYEANPVKRDVPDPELPRHLPELDPLLNRDVVVVSPDPQGPFGRADLSVSGWYRLDSEGRDRMFVSARAMLPLGPDEREIALARYEASVERARAQVAEARTRYSELLFRVENAEKKAGIADDRARAAAIRMDAGIDDALSVLQAQIDALAARIEAFEAKIEADRFLTATLFDFGWDPDEIGSLLWPD